MVAIAVIYLLSVPKKPTRVATSRHRIFADHEPFQFEYQLDEVEAPFRVDWPPQTPSDGRRTKSPPLLWGNLLVSAGQKNGRTMMNFRIELTRGDSDSDRARWNQQLKFPEYDWMSRVRVWDSERAWLWPNLPYLLRAHGVEREQRYGGVDPGKRIDNDFAAVVIKSAGTGTNDGQFTSIGGNWHSPPVGWIDKRTVIHHALSEDLQRTVPDSQMRGELGVWLIYADFLDFSPPRSWPDEPEYDGGILAFFSIQWKRNDDDSLIIQSVKNEIPPKSTGVRWEEWLNLVRSGE